MKISEIITDKYKLCIPSTTYYELLADVIEVEEEQESIFDKIRTEIEALNPVDYVSMSSYEGHKGASDMKDDILEIIDKYKEEKDAT